MYLFSQLFLTCFYQPIYVMLGPAAVMSLWLFCGDWWTAKKKKKSFMSYRTWARVILGLSFFLFFKTDRFLCFFVNVFPLQHQNTRTRYVINRSSQQPKQVLVRLTEALSRELSHLQITSAKVILKCFLTFRNRRVSLKLTTYQSCLWIANFSSRNLSL